MSQKHCFVVFELEGEKPDIQGPMPEVCADALILVWKEIEKTAKEQGFDSSKSSKITKHRI